MVCRPGVDDFEHLSSMHDIEQLPHRRGGIHDAHSAISTAGAVAQRNQRAQAGAIHEGRPGQINFDGQTSRQPQGQRSVPRHLQLLPGDRELLAEKTKTGLGAHTVFHQDPPPAHSGGRFV